MSTALSIILAVVYVSIHGVRERLAVKRHKESTAAQDRIATELAAQRLRIEEIDNTLRGSPFVTHPTPYKR